MLAQPGVDQGRQLGVERGHHLVGGLDQGDPQAAVDYADLAERLLSQLAPLLGAAQGVLYRLNRFDSKGNGFRRSASDRHAANEGSNAHAAHRILQRNKACQNGAIRLWDFVMGALSPRSSGRLEEVQIPRRPPFMA